MSFNISSAKQAEEEFNKDPSIKNRNCMIMKHTGLVHTITKKYSYFVSKDNYEDLFQEGMIGLMIAAEKFDPAKKIKFATYAGWWVRSKIQVFIADDRAIYFNTLKKLAFDRNPNKKLPNEDERRRVAMQYPRSFTDPCSNAEDNSITLQEVIGDPKIDIEEAQIRKDEIQLLHIIAEPFFEKYKHGRKIFTERIIADEPKTLSEIGKELGFSREWIRLIEKALKDEITKAYQEYCQLPNRGT